ncbi:Fe(3+) ABC transporter substrate-binding protein [Azospirillum sp. sgz301742]
MLRSKLGALALFAGICVGAGAQAAEVNVYNSRHYSTDKAIYEAFTTATGIKVNLIEGNPDELIQRMKSEGADSPADLFIAVDAERLALAAREGLLAPLPSKSLEAVIPTHLRDAQGQWYGLSIRARILVYAKDRVKPEDLKDYEDLAKPVWKGRVLARSGTHPYNLALTASLVAANGEEKTEAWAKGLVANLARAPKGGDTDQIKAVAAGEGDVAISNSYYLGKLMTSAKPEDRAVAEKVGAIFPNQSNRGTHMNLSGAGVVKTAQHREEAVKLLEYLASPDAQRAFADGNMEFPVNATVQPHPALVSLGAFKQDSLNAAAYLENNQKALQIMDRAGWK